MDDSQIIGHGSHRYKVVKGWGVLDLKQNPVLDCHEMVLDKKKRILLLTNDIKNNFLVYNKDGQLLEAWGHDYPGAHGLTLWDENGTEFLFLCDTERHFVQKLTLDGKVIMTIHCPMETGLYAEEAKFHPSESCVAPNGDIYIVDGYGEQWIFHYNAQGELRNHFGGKGKNQDQFQFAHGLCIDRRKKKQDRTARLRTDAACFQKIHVGRTFYQGHPVARRISQPPGDSWGRIVLRSPVIPRTLGLKKWVRHHRQRQRSVHLQSRWIGTGVCERQTGTIDPGWQHLHVAA